MNRLAAGVVVSACLLCAGGCASYYQVKDPGSGKMYYTNSKMAERYNSSGAVTFWDAASGSTVTLQSSEVKEISEDEFKAAVPSPVKKK